MTAASNRRTWRWALAILLVIVTLPVAAFAALHIWFESTAGKPPTMFADVPMDFRYDQPWTARMTGTFPAGTPETVLVSRLRSEGFEIDQKARSARYEWSEFPCDHMINAEWTVENGSVVGSRARYSNACL